MVLVHEKRHKNQNEESKSNEEVTDNSKLPALNIAKPKVGINQFGNHSINSNFRI